MKYFFTHCVKSVRIWSPHFPAFGLNTETYFVNLRIQSECGKMRTRKTSDTETYTMTHSRLFASILKKKESFVTIMPRKNPFTFERNEKNKNLSKSEYLKL